MCIPLFYRGSRSSWTRILASSSGLDLTTLACAHRRLALRYPHPVLSGNIHVQEERYGIEDLGTSFALAHSHLATGLNILLGTQRPCNSFLWVTTLRSTTTYSDIHHLIHLPSDIANTRRLLFMCKHPKYQCSRTVLTCPLLLEFGLQLGQHLHTVALVSMLSAALQYPLEEVPWFDKLTTRRTSSRSHAAAQTNKLIKIKKIP